MMTDDFTPKSEPDRSTPKVLGVLNIVFALGLMACGACYGFYALVFSMIGSIAEIEASSTAARVAQAKAELKVVEDQLAQTQDEASKQDLEAQLTTLRERADEEPDEDLAAARQVSLNDPGYVSHFVVDMVTNLILNALMLISGAGMLALRGWARKLAIGVAWAKIFRLVMLTASAFLVVAPVISNMMSRAMTAGEEMAVKAAEEAAALEEATSKPVEEVPTIEPVPVPGEDAQKEEHADQPKVEEKGEGEAPAKTSEPPPGEGENPAAKSNVQTSVRRGGVQVNVTSGQFTPQMRAEMENAARGVGLAFGVYSAGMLVLGIIYPIVSIILLNRKAVKAAFIAPREYA